MSTIQAVIFDMDGLLIDSEPLWQEAGSETLSTFGINLTDEQYHSSTGLRTPEWIDHWFGYFGIDKAHAPEAIKTIEATAIAKIKARGEALPGVEYIMNYFHSRNIPIAIASSSPMKLIDEVVEKLSIGQFLQVKTSAENLAYGKPHPEVFINCAKELDMRPQHCLVFEDSFNGMIAAKAAKMKCAVVPAPSVQQELRWKAADLVLGSLNEFKGF